MPKFIYPLLLLLFPLFLISQNPDEKRDHAWLFGYPGGLSNPEPPFGNAILDFNFSPADVFYTGGTMSFSETNASICDENGNLLFYTNGIYIGKGNGQPMANGTGLSPGLLTDEYAEIGMIVPGGALILPIPEQDSQYIVFHGLMEWRNEPPYSIYSNWYYSLVDMTKLNGQGVVTEKNVEFLDGFFTVGDIAAVRHGNGRDWWLFVQESETNKYFSFLLSPNGLSGPFVQEVGPNVVDGGYQTLFSPDGTKYARNENVHIYNPDTLYLFDFDRCTGLLSNPKYVVYGDTAFSAGIAFSPNSRYLYASHFKHIFQFDTESDDLLASMDTVATWVPDTILGSSHFNLAALAPDGKIYVCSGGARQSLHVINHPDLEADSVGFEKDGLTLPVFNSYSMPTFPNFRLGKWEGSPCDTIVVSNVGEVDFKFSEVRLYPNPAGSFVAIDTELLRGTALEFHVFDVVGRSVLSGQWRDSTNEHVVDISGIPPGIYFYSATGTSGILKSGKLIVQR